ncbi:MAG: class I SAM-dependent methyltransferase [Pseudobdellovibrio sp.]|nr:class I SAM-dependent methyltransferase [Pseudobdellovibrio sp.]
MRSYQQSIIYFLQQKDLSACEAELILFWKSMSAQDAAKFFTDLSFLVTVLRFLQEQYWLYNNEKPEPAQFGHFVKRFYKKELKTVLFMHATLESAQVRQVEEMRKQATLLQKAVVQFLKNEPGYDRPLFVSTCLKLMSDFFEFEYQLKIKNEGLSGYTEISLERTFDALDEIFQIKCDITCNSKITTEERIFEGSGVGVQSSYSTILLALRYLKIPQKARFVDLGSGYGRVGFVIGLMRPDIQFHGYEFVDYRVDMSKKISEDFNMPDHVHFYHQDLSLNNFLIPEAEVYYLFGPFTDATYAHIIEQLNVIGAKKPIVIITKGNAREHFMTVMQRKHWSAPQVFHQGNFCLFRSHGR